MATTALEACALLEEDGISVGVLLCECIKPYDHLAQEIAMLLPEHVRNVVYLEEEILSGGFGMNLSYEIRNLIPYESIRHEIIAVDDNFAVTESDRNVWEIAEVDAVSVCNRIKNMFE